MYMSYCRNEGTLQEISACLDQAQSYIDGVESDHVSTREVNCFMDILRNVYYFMAENELLDEYGELDEEKLSEIRDSMLMVNK